MNFYGVKKEEAKQVLQRLPVMDQYIQIHDTGATDFVYQIIYLYGIHKYAQLKIIVITTKHTNIALFKQPIYNVQWLLNGGLHIH